MGHYRFTIEIKEDEGKINKLRDIAINAVGAQVKSTVIGHVVHEVNEDDDWKSLPMESK